MGWEHAQFIGPDTVQVLMGIWPLVIMGVAYGIQMLSKLKSGSNQNKLAQFNAQVSEQQATDALMRGKDDEERFRQGVKTLIGSQRASFAGNNVDIASGSAADVQADAAFLGELDAQTIRTNAMREAWGYRQQAEEYRRGGQAALSAARWGAAETALSGTGSILLQRYGWGEQKKQS